LSQTSIRGAKQRNVSVASSILEEAMGGKRVKAGEARQRHAELDDEARGRAPATPIGPRVVVVGSNSKAGSCAADLANHLRVGNTAAELRFSNW